MTVTYLFPASRAHLSIEIQVLRIIPRCRNRSRRDASCLHADRHPRAESLLPIVAFSITCRLACMCIRARVVAPLAMRITLVPLVSNECYRYVILSIAVRLHHVLQRRRRSTIPEKQFLFVSTMRRCSVHHNRINNNISLIMFDIFLSLCRLKSANLFSLASRNVVEAFCTFARLNHRVNLRIGAKRRQVSTISRQESLVTVLRHLESGDRDTAVA